MKNTLYAVVAATLAMLVTSGLVAYATAAPPDNDAAVEAFIGRMLDAHLAEVSER